MVHGADDATGGVENDVEVDHAQSGALLDDTGQNEQVGDEDSGKEFEEVFDLEMDDPEARKLCGGEVLAGVGQQADRVEGWDRKCGEEEEPGHVGDMLGIEAVAKSAIKDEDREKEADDEHYLPEVSEVEVFEALVTEPDAV